jgi:hypothetical protein
MKWQLFLENTYQTRASSYPAFPKFYPPASLDDIKELGKIFGANVPQSLQELLQETNGVMEMIQIDKKLIPNLSLIWSVDEMLAENQALRDTPSLAVLAAAKNLLFFSPAGVDGVLFAISYMDETIHVWHPTGNTLTPIAASLETFLDGWLTGKLSV